MNKSLKLTFISAFILSGIVVAFRSLMSFFNGSGVMFVALILISIFLTSLLVKKETRTSILDIAILSYVFLGLEFVTFFTTDILILFNLQGILIYQSVVSMLGLLMFVYFAIRWIFTLNNKHITFNFAKKEKKQKAQRELTNGTLEDKPKKVLEHSNFENVRQQAVTNPPASRPVKSEQRETSLTQTSAESRPVVLDQSAYETIRRENLPKIDKDENSEK